MTCSVTKVPIFGPYILNMICIPIWASYLHISLFKPVVPCKEWVTLATMVNNRQRYIAQNMSQRYCVQRLRAVEESSVWGRGTFFPSLPGLIGSSTKQTSFKNVQGFLETFPEVLFKRSENIENHSIANHDIINPKSPFSEF